MMESTFWGAARALAGKDAGQLDLLHRRIQKEAQLGKPKPRIVKGA